MGGFKRFYFILYFILSIIGVGFLLVIWMGLEPMASWLAPLEATTWFFWVVLGCVAVCVIGLIVVLCRALFTPSDKRNLVMSTDLGQYRVSRQALRDLISNTISNHADIDCIDVRVKVNDRDMSTARVTAEVGVPQSAVLGILGPQLQREMKYAFESFTGGQAGEIDVTFSEVKNTTAGALPAGTDKDLATPPVSQQYSDTKSAGVAPAAAPPKAATVTRAQRRAAAAQRKAAKKAAAKAEQEAAIAAATSDYVPSDTAAENTTAPYTTEQTTSDGKVTETVPGATPEPVSEPATGDEVKAADADQVSAAVAETVGIKQTTEQEDGPKPPSQDGDD